MWILGTWIVTASLYVILACGYVVIYRASRVLNFAFGGTVLLLGYLGITFFASICVVSVTLGAIAISGFILGYLLYWRFIKPMTGQSPFTIIVLTIGLGIMLEAICILGWRGHAESVSLGWDQVFSLPGGVRFSSAELIVLVTAILLITFLCVFYRYSSIGRQIRATAEKPLLAAQRGINVHMVLGVSWSIASFIAGIGALMFANNYAVSLEVPPLATKAFVVALVGGLDSLLGAILAALLISLLEVIITSYTDPRLAYVIPYVILLIVLIFRPWGFFGRKEEIERV